MIIAVEGVSYAYGSRQALRGLDFHLNARGIFGILGPNGSGKSTLFRLLSTLILPSAGHIEVGGFDTRRLPHEVRRRIGVVFQSNSLDKNLTVDENLQAQGYLYGLTGRTFWRSRDECLERLSLLDRRGDLVKTLSGGLARRVEIAKALLHKPQILLLDEPSTGLDPAARHEMWSFLREQDGVTVLLTTHLLDEAARCERLLLLHEGRRVIEGSPEELVATVGGEVIEFETSDVAELASGLASRLGLKPVSVEGSVRVEVEKAHRVAAEAVEALPGLISGVRFHKPTLEDVFSEAHRREVGVMTAVWALVWRETLRLWRERSRVAGFVLMPLGFWFLVSSGFGDFQRFFAGSVVLTIMFASVFSNMSLIEDRREGFLKSMLVSPAPRWALVMGKVLGGALLAWLQSLAFLLFSPFPTSPGGYLTAAVCLLIVAVAFTALGFTTAWVINSTQGFHAVLNLVMMPAWMISGALFPIATASPWLQWLMRLNPLAHALALVESALAGVPARFGFGVSVAFTLVTAVGLLALATAAVSRPDTGE